MTGYVLSPLAEADIDSIWDYTAENWSGDRANRYVRDIHAACEQLASGRRIGRSIDDIRPGYLKTSVGSHFVVYRIVDGVVDVIRVLHQRMDMPTHLGN